MRTWNLRQHLPWLWSTTKVGRLPRRFKCYLVLLAPLIALTYLFFQSDFFTKLVYNPTLDIQGAWRGKCCKAEDVRLDVCGNYDCIWPCPSPQELQIESSSFRSNAFFHETTGSSSLDVRQACAIESLALINRNLTINLLMTGNDVDWNATTMRSLQIGYDNINVVAISLGDYFVGTPLEHWYFCTTWNYGPYAVSHLSDALRFLTLYKYGGYYFDLDIIMLKPVSPYRNFVGAENNDALAAGAFHVDYRHPVIEMAVEEFRNTYRKDLWGHNGPLLLTRVLKKWCRMDKVASMNQDKCYGFSILSPKTFYPVIWLDWERYFAVADMQWEDETIGIHVWNKVSAGKLVYKNSNQVYTQLARSKCPKTFAAAPHVF